jgi:hypothetical protein
MADPKQVADHARRRAEDAAARAEAARTRVEALRRRQLDAGGNPEQADESLRAAELSERRAKEAARIAHKQAADALEERARDLADQGDAAGARRALERADEARERESHT